MLHVPGCAARRHGRNPDPSNIQASASGRLRERVLANVRGGAEEPIDRRQRRRASVPALAIAVVLGIALGAGIALSLSSSHSSAGGARPSSGVQASLRPVGGHAELAVAGLPEPPIGEVYEVWLLRPGRAPLATDALFTVTSAGSASVDVPAGASSGAREVMVTSEPLGGSVTPTGPVALRVKAGRAP